MTGTAAGRGGGGQSVQDSRPVSILARITSHIAGNKYAWVRLDEGDVPEFGDLVDAPEFSTGDDLPAYEIGGSDSVAEGSKVRLWPGGVGDLAYYTFTAPGGTATMGGTAGGCGWAAGLTAAHCLEVKLLAVAGACACNPTSASKPFIITGGPETWSYPGPLPPPVCGQCANGSPESWTVTLANGTGDFAALNGTYTLTRDGTNKCLWVGSGGTGASAGLEVSGDNWTLTVTAGGTSATWTATRPGCCAPLAMTHGAQSGTGARPTAGTIKLAAACPGTVLICGVAYSVTFSLDACGRPCLSLGTGGSGGSIKGVLESCSRNVATFVVGGSLCPGCDPSANFARIQVRLALCGWQGPGWYCVRDCGTDDACEALELVEGDQYDLTLEICSGPFESEEEAQAACTGLVSAPCLYYAPDNAVPARYGFSIAGVTNDGSLMCANVNNAHQVLFSETPGGNGTITSAGCTWGTVISNDPPTTNYASGCAAGVKAVFILRVAGVNIELYTTCGSSGKSWTRPLTGYDWRSPMTLNRTGTGSDGGTCQNWPATVTLTPVLP